MFIYNNNKSASFDYKTRRSNKLRVIEGKGVEVITSARPKRSKNKKIKKLKTNSLKQKELKQKIKPLRKNNIEFLKSLGFELN